MTDEKETSSKKDKIGFWKSFPDDLRTISRVAKYSLYASVAGVVLYIKIWPLFPWILLYSLMLTVWIGYKVMPVIRKTDSLEVAKCYILAGFYLMLAPIAIAFVPLWHITWMETWSWIRGWLIFFVIALMVCSIIFTKYIRSNVSYKRYSMLLIAYVAMLSCSANVVFDHYPVHNETVIIDKIAAKEHTDSDGAKDYTYHVYVDLRDFGGSEKAEIQIDEKTYDKYREMSGNKYISVNIHPGALKQPWVILPQWDRT